MKRTMVMGGLWAAALMGQTTINGSRTILGNWDASGALSTKPNQTGSALPGTCATGQTYFLTTAAAGQSLYLCQPANTWTAIAGGSGGAVTRALVFDGATTSLADGSTVTWNCGSGSGASCTANWTAPAGVNALRIVAWSGGGGGSGSTAGSQSGPGGGGGGYADFVCTVTPGNAYTVTVGMGGTGSTNGTTVAAGNGGNSGFGTTANPASCFSIVGGQGGNGASAADYGGYLNGSARAGWYSLTSAALNNPANAFCTGINTPGYAAGRMDEGGCGGGINSTAAAAGMSGGTGTGGAGAGGSGGYNNASGGAGGTSGYGGSGGAGGGWTAGGGLAACGNGNIPGGGGGAAGASTSCNGNQTGCNGARGEVRIIYTK